MTGFWKTDQNVPLGLASCLFQNQITYFEWTDQMVYNHSLYSVKKLSSDKGVRGEFSNSNNILVFNAKVNACGVENKQNIHLVKFI